MIFDNLNKVNNVAWVLYCMCHETGYNKVKVKWGVVKLYIDKVCILHVALYYRQM